MIYAIPDTFLEVFPGQIERVHQDVSTREFLIATLRTRPANACDAGNNHWWKNEALTATEIDCFQFGVTQEAVNVDYEIVNAVFL